jgi:hypothetical protein
MINRLDDYLPPAEPTTSADAIRPAAGSLSSDWGQLASQVESWIVSHPGASLASAFFLGAALAWWIKRR